MPDRSPLALVTGTSSGIGEALARELLRRGWNVVGVSRRDSPLEGPGYAHLRLDLADLEQLAEEVEASVGPRISADRPARLALVNNAADAGFLGTVVQVEPRAMLRVFAVNVVAATWLMGWMVRRSDPSVPLRIVNVSSGAGAGPYPGLGSYGASKAALRMVGSVLAAELDASAKVAGAPRDLAVLSYSPGPVDTPMQAAARAAPTETFPLREIFLRWEAEGQLAPPRAPAGEIADYLEADGYPSFLDCRAGEVGQGRP